MNQSQNSNGEWFFNGRPLDFLYHVPFKKEGHVISPIDYLRAYGVVPTDEDYGELYEQLKQDGYEYKSKR